MTQEQFNEDEKQFNNDEMGAIAEFVQELPWGDIDAQLFCFERALARALEATADDTGDWWVTADRHDLKHELAVGADVMHGFSTVEKASYVARLVQTMAAAYGVVSDPHGLSGELDEAGIGAVVRRINDIAWGLW